MAHIFPNMRMRRLRSNPGVRDLLQETEISLKDLIYPIFVEEEIDDFAPVESMPGIYRIPERKLDVAMKEIARCKCKNFACKPMKPASFRRVTISRGSPKALKTQTRKKRRGAKRSMLRIANLKRCTASALHHAPTPTPMRA